MNSSWIKFMYERTTYVVALDYISTVACTENGRLMFWLPDGKIQIIIHRQTNPDTYQQILDYIQKTTGKSLENLYRKCAEP